MVSYFKQSCEIWGADWRKEEQGRERKRIGLGWSEKSKDNQRIADWVYQREVRNFD